MPSQATNEIATRNVTYAHLGNSTTINCINKSKKEKLWSNDGQKQVQWT